MARFSAREALPSKQLSGGGFMFRTSMMNCPTSSAIGAIDALLEASDPSRVPLATPKPGTVTIHRIHSRPEPVHRSSSKSAVCSLRRPVRAQHLGLV